MFRKASAGVWLAAVAVMTASVASAGIEYKYVVTNEGQTKDANSKSITKIWMDQEKMRIETLEGTGFTSEKGAYMLTTDAGKTLYMVDPSSKSYMAWDMGRMMNMTKMVQIKISNNKFEKLLDEDGGTVMGYPTRHYRFRTTYDTEMSVFGIKQKSSCVQEEDAWSTTKIKQQAMNAWAKMGVNMMGNNPELAKLVDMRMQQMEGVPLKTIMVTTTKSGADAKPTTSKTTMEFAEIKESGLAASLFEMPKDYKETVIPKFDDDPDVRKARKAVEVGRGVKAKLEEDKEAAGEDSEKNIATEIKDDIKAEAQKEVEAVKAIPPTSDEIKNDIKAEIKQEVESVKPRPPTRDDVKEAIKNKLKFW